ncbi:hypothetical protein C0J52_20890 [Blattella germanica]|nr:hypothetical protein C0J52_20890 [Blattella germanica]
MKSISRRRVWNFDNRGSSSGDKRAANCKRRVAMACRDVCKIQISWFAVSMWWEPTEQNSSSNSKVAQLTVEKVHIHPDYKSNDRKSEADLAIMILKDAVEYTIYVKPICLWIFSSDINQIVGQTGTVVGWGKDETGSSSAEPHKVSMPIVSHGDCVLSNKEFFYYVTNRTFCAGMRDGTGPCSGDSGGGFMIGYEEGDVLRWYLRGVVHLSLYDRQNQQCDLQSYLIYTDVAVFMDWIREFVP